ncbi:MAG: type 1 glutamine amidotransferase [Desulfobacterota bacterium]|nr:type 1 glutamine amidotransferase [Thermodesulfobacteriota bacterium]MDW8002477.1 type 1 glutamine amidotransferase [Deltaproteobacteria bacterium]
MKDKRERKNVLIVKNAIEEGPGNIAEFLKAKGIEFHEIEAYKDRYLPGSSFPYEYVVVLGGPMGVYEIDRYPYLAMVAKLIELALSKGKKVLGICLGAQLLAYVLGARVYDSGELEIGWCEIELTDEGSSDECISTFFGEKRKCEVFQWHRDTFDLPKGALRLASSKRFLNQAFSYFGSLGLQFHPEITPSMVKEWFRDRKDFEQIVQKTKVMYASYRKAAENLYEKFFKLERR